MPVIRHTDEGVVLGYDFETESGAYAWEEITFVGVVAYGFTYAAHCTREQMEPYDELADVVGSRWARELKEVDEGCRHFRIYFDEIGCYEFLAKAFVPPPGS